jgi:class 3 adenylate cyclase
VVGYYHKPRIEDRIFMFLDLKGSTSIAERLSRDVLNTTARIEGVCNQFSKRLIASRELVESLPMIPPGFSAEALGAVSLTGKDAPLELIALA